jgi:hypothetical protein
MHQVTEFIREFSHFFVYNWRNMKTILRYLSSLYWATRKG